MISREEQRRFDEIARQLRTSDPDFVARVADEGSPRMDRVMLAMGVMLWAIVPAFAYAGGWIAVVLCSALLVVAGALVLKARHARVDR